MSFPCQHYGASHPQAVINHNNNLNEDDLSLSPVGPSPWEWDIPKCLGQAWHPAPSQACAPSHPGLMAREWPAPLLAQPAVANLHSASKSRIGSRGGQKAIRTGVLSLLAAAPHLPSTPGLVVPRECWVAQAMALPSYTMFLL